MRRDAGVVGGDADKDLARANTRSTEPSTFSPERNEWWKRKIAPALLRRVELAGEFAAHLVEGARRRALEREDRLLLVADREHRAPHVRPRAAGGEFRDDGAHDAPLLRAGVLRLVDQHVVDAEIELVEHPGGRRAAEQLNRLVDQVVVIEQRAALFFAPVARDHVGRDGDERAGALARGERAFALEQLADALLLGEQALGPNGCACRQACR